MRETSSLPIFAGPPWLILSSERRRILSARLMEVVAKGIGIPGGKASAARASVKEVFVTCALLKEVIAEEMR